MSIILNDNVTTNAPKPSDSRYFNGLVPWTDVASVNTGIVSTQRYQGLTVNIAGVEYWYLNGIADADLIIKPASSTVDDNAFFYALAFG